MVPGRGGADTDEILTNRSLRRTMLAISLYRKSLAPLLVFLGRRRRSRRAGAAGQGAGDPEPSASCPRAAPTPRARSRRRWSASSARAVSRASCSSPIPSTCARTRALLEQRGFTVLGAPTASSGPGDPESRLHLLREIATELAACVYYRLRGWI